MYSDLKTLLFTFYVNPLCILAFPCISHNSAINTYKFKSSVELYSIEVYLIGKGVVEVPDCHRFLNNVISS
jgi:hypothetical protein